ncbi:MAG: hypothetical protein ACLUD2_06660 [Clostridium sp.]
MERLLRDLFFAEGFTSQQKSTALNFKIPVYSNMPETPCAQPTLSGSPNNKLNGLGWRLALTPTFNRDTYSYDLIVDPFGIQCNGQRIGNRFQGIGTWQRKCISFQRNQ